MSFPLFSRPAKFPPGLAAGLIGLALVGLLAAAGVIERLENLAGDALRRRLAEPLTDRIALVALDDTSLARAEEEFDVSWPWPRETYGQAVAFFRKAGAEAVVFDFVFTSRSPRGPEDDEAFAAAARERGGVVAALSTKPEEQPAALARFRKLAPLHGVNVPDAMPNSDPARSVETPPEPLWSAFAAVGDVSDLADPDGLRRRVRLVRRMGDRAFPSLALAALRTAKGEAALDFANRRFTVGDASLPAHADGSVSLLFRSLPTGRRATPLFDVISSEAGAAEGRTPLVDPALFRGKIVLVGGTAPGLLDLRPTPLSRLVGSSAGYFVHATALDNLLTGRALRVVPATGAGWFVILLVAIGAGLAAERMPVRGTVALVVAGGLLLGTLAVGVYARADTLLPVATPLLALTFAAAAGATERGIRESRRRRAIQAALGQFLSPAVFTKLLADDRPLETGGDRYEVSLFFSDLQGFTGFSEKLDPKALVEILNLYLTEMADVVVGELDGYVDKYIGDAIMAFWGAPLPNIKHAEAACRAAWRCQHRLAKIQPELARRGLDAGEEGMVMRIGLHTGEAVIGLMGSARKLNYTAMGDCVNLASRLEGANKAYGTRVLLSDAIRLAAGTAISVRELDLMRVKGKLEPTRIWELTAVEGEPPGALDSGLLGDWEAALSLYRGRRFAEARAAFEAFLLRRPGDGPSRLYISRCRAYESAPPPADWDGVYTMTTK